MFMVCINTKFNGKKNDIYRLKARHVLANNVLLLKHLGFLFISVTNFFCHSCLNLLKKKAVQLGEISIHFYCQ